MEEIISALKKILVFLLNRPKIILVGLVLILVIFGVSSLFNSNGNDVTTDGTNNVIVYGMPFNIPEGYVEGNHHSFTNGEYVELNDGAWSIEISVSDDRDFKESEYITSSYSKTINGKEGTVYIYKTNNMAFVYQDNGYLIVIRNALTRELEEIIIG